MHNHLDPEKSGRRRDELARLYAAAERMRLLLIALVALIAILLSAIATSN